MTSFLLGTTNCFINTLMVVYINANIKQKGEGGGDWFNTNNIKIYPNNRHHDLQLFLEDFLVKTSEFLQAIF